jgi:hypothetical protein
MPWRELICFTRIAGVFLRVNTKKFPLPPGLTQQLLLLGNADQSRRVHAVRKKHEMDIVEARAALKIAPQTTTGSRLNNQNHNPPGL